jgi:hypothetical protein
MGARTNHSCPAQQPHCLSQHLGTDAKYHVQADKLAAYEQRHVWLCRFLHIGSECPPLGYVARPLRHLFLHLLPLLRHMGCCQCVRQSPLPPISWMLAPVLVVDFVFRWRVATSV